MSESSGRSKSESDAEGMDYDWRRSAACRGQAALDFFPEPSDEEANRKAVGVCSTCFVVDQCLEYALETNQQWGVWGGTTEKERKTVRKDWLANKRQGNT